MDFPGLWHKKYSTPTPADKLIICDRCQRGEWTIFRQGHVSTCTRCWGRMREGTKSEYKEALSRLAKLTLFVCDECQTAVQAQEVVCFCKDCKKVLRRAYDYEVQPVLSGRHPYIRWKK